MEMRFPDPDDADKTVDLERFRSKKKAASIKARPPLQVTAAALKDMNFPEIKWVVPGFIAEGATILAGAPKLGKSWLALEMAIAKATGGTCLGNITTPDEGDVLYLALEDNLRRLQKRMDRLMPAGSPWPPRLTFATEWPKSGKGGLDKIREWARSVPDPRFTIVDVLTMFRDPLVGREGQYEHDYNAIKVLQELASELGIALLIIHHTRKARDQVDPFDRMSGTLGLGGAADAAMILDRDSNGVTLYVRGRDVPESDTAVSFSKDKVRWSVLGKASEVRVSDERRSILDVLKVAVEPMSPGDIAAATHVTSNATKQLLFKMMVAGEVKKVGRGRYIHPERTDLEGEIGQDDR